MSSANTWLFTDVCFDHIWELIVKIFNIYMKIVSTWRKRKQLLQINYSLEILILQLQNWRLKNRYQISQIDIDKITQLKELQVHTKSFLLVQVAILSEMVNDYKKKNQSQDLLIAFLRFHATRECAEPTYPGKLYFVECGFRLLTKWPEIVEGTWSQGL